MTISEHDSYWLYQLAQAIEGIEKDAICRIDVDIPAESEVEKLKRLVGVLQDYSQGYDEEGDQPRLSLALFRLLDKSPTADPVSPVSVEERPWPKRTPLEHIIAYAEQVAHDGILPSQAWFQETADTLTQLQPLLGAEPPALQILREKIVTYQRGTQPLNQTERERVEVAVIQGTLDAVLADIDELLALRSGGEALPPQKVEK